MNVGLDNLKSDIHFVNADFKYTSAGATATLAVERTSKG